MGKYIIDDPIFWNEQKAKHTASTTKATVKVFETNGNVDSIKYVADVTYKGYFWNSGTVDAIGVLSMTRRREAVDPITNLYDNVTGDDLADTRVRKTFASPAIDPDGTKAMYPFTIKMPGMAKLKYTDDFILQSQCREGGLVFTGDITWSVGKNVKRKTSFSNRSSNQKRK